MFGRSYSNATYNFTYSAWETTKLTERTAAGFTGGNISEDGTLIVGDKGDQEEPAGALSTPMPSYGSAGEFPNWPLMTNEKAELLILKAASAPGASDGYRYTP